jgi:hypothetical protein
MIWESRFAGRSFVAMIPDWNAPYLQICLSPSAWVVSCGHRSYPLYTQDVTIAKRIAETKFREYLRDMLAALDTGEKIIRDPLTGVTFESESERMYYMGKR